jgi:hypothetical protein
MHGATGAAVIVEQLAQAAQSRDVSPSQRDLRERAATDESTTTTRSQAPQAATRLSPPATRMVGTGYQVERESAAGGSPRRITLNSAVAPPAPWIVASAGPATSLEAAAQLVDLGRGAGVASSDAASSSSVSRHTGVSPIASGMPSAVVRALQLTAADVEELHRRQQRILLGASGGGGVRSTSPDPFAVPADGSGDDGSRRFVEGQYSSVIAAGGMADAGHSSDAAGSFSLGGPRAMSFLDIQQQHDGSADVSGAGVLNTPSGSHHRLVLIGPAGARGVAVMRASPGSAPALADEALAGGGDDDDDDGCGAGGDAMSLLRARSAGYSSFFGSAEGAGGGDDDAALTPQSGPAPCGDVAVATDVSLRTAADATSPAGMPSSSSSFASAPAAVAPSLVASGMPRRGERGGDFAYRGRQTESRTPPADALAMARAQRQRAAGLQPLPQHLHSRFAPSLSVEALPIVTLVSQEEGDDDNGEPRTRGNSAGDLRRVRSRGAPGSATAVRFGAHVSPPTPQHRGATLHSPQRTSQRPTVSADHGRESALVQTQDGSLFRFASHPDTFASASITDSRNMSSWDARSVFDASVDRPSRALRAAVIAASPSANNSGVPALSAAPTAAAGGRRVARDVAAAARGEAHLRPQFYVARGGHLAAAAGAGDRGSFVSNASLVSSVGNDHIPRAVSVDLLAGNSLGGALGFAVSADVSMTVPEAGDVAP